MRDISKKQKTIAVLSILFIIMILIVFLGESDQAAAIAPIQFDRNGAAFMPGDTAANIDLGVIWYTGQRGSVELVVYIYESGYYMLVFTYHAIDDSVQAVELLVSVGSETAYLIALDKSFSFDVFPFMQDYRGDEMRPRLDKYMGIMTMPAYRNDASSSTPILFYMNVGYNTIFLESVGGAASLKYISVVSIVEIPNYAEYSQRFHESANTGTLLIMEAEHVVRMSSRTIMLHSLSEAGVSPETYGRRVFNTIGGISWQIPGQWIEWEIYVPRDGLYNIAFKYRQNFNPALNMFRRVSINGEVPFAELLNVAFPPSSSWSNLVLGKDEQPFNIFLTQGVHTLRLTIVYEPYYEIFNNLMDVAAEIRQLDIYVRGVTGVFNAAQVDTYRIFHLERFIPDLSFRLFNLANEVEAQMDALTAITGVSQNNFNLLRHEVVNLRRFANDLDLITNSYDAFLRTQTNIASFAVMLMEQPLLLDTVMIASPNTDLPRARMGFFRTAGFMFRQLFASFTDDRGGIAATSPDVLEVWMQRGRDYVNLMQQHANEFFTPITGQRVNVNHIPGPDLLILANAAGQQPAVVSGIGRDVPFNFALRNAIVPLCQFEGYHDIIANIPQGALIPYHFAGRNYALPEEIIFNVLFFRRDIFDDFNLAVPSTWDDTKRLIPTLQQNNMNFWLAWGDWITFYYQFEIEIYTPDGLDLALDSEEGFQVFQFWSELYTRYNFPHRIGSFYQSFRRGHIPVGISSLADYFFLRLAAPEISGMWGIAPVPGIINDDGINVRWQSGDQRGVMLFRTDEEREAQGWEFIRWWMDIETQTRFALDLDFSLGQEFRWFSSMPEVVRAIPWDENDRRTILTQLEWFKGIPYAPGGSYMLERDMRNALTDVVIDGRNPRDALTHAIRSTRQEMLRVQRRFDIINEYGEVLRTLPMMTAPLPDIAFTYED